MRGYTQLTRDERYQIYALRKAGHSQKEIAEVLRRNPSTISRELGRNKGLKGYRPEQAHRLAQNRKKERDRTRIPESTWARVEQLLREDWSPEQISGWLTREEGVSVSHERIYQHVYEDKRRGGDLHRHLRCQKPRRKRYGHYDRRGQIRERVSIDERPEVVEARSRIGDWEADTVIGKLGGAVLVTLVERRSRLSLIALAPNKTAEAVKAAILKVLQPLSAQVHTLTYDNGKEFAYHMEIAKVLKADGYFAHPYHSWERGLNENTNGLIRQYLSKGTDFNKLTDRQVLEIMDNKRVFDLVKDFGTSESPKSTRSSTTHWCPGRPGHPAFRHNIASSLRLHTGLPYDWTPRSDAPLGSPLAPSARRVSRVASRLPGTTRLRFALHGGQRLNNRPRKCLGYKTPNQVFFGIKPPVALAS